MSALNIFTPLRVLKTILTIAIFVAASLLIPQIASASANTLPMGVLAQQSCGTFTVDIYGYGAGLMQNIVPIENTNRRVSYINPTDGCAVVQWQSSSLAAVQVIFTELSNEPVEINLSKKNFGYTFATQQNNLGSANHTTILKGLEAGKAYAYRLVTRAHPSALPSISDPMVFVVGAKVSEVSASPKSPKPIPEPVVATVPTEIQTTVTPIKQSEVKLLPVDIKPEINNIGEGSLKAVYAPATEVETVEDSEASAGEATSTVPSALAAVNAAFGDSSNELSLWKKITAFFSNSTASKNRPSFSSGVGFFERDQYIVPTLFFLVLLFLLQQLILPVFSINLKNPILYWIYGSVALTVISSVFMLYYITLVGIAMFLGLLAWYLTKNVPTPDSNLKENKKDVAQQKLLSVNGMMNKGALNNTEEVKK